VQTPTPAIFKMQSVAQSIGCGCAKGLFPTTTNLKNKKTTIDFCLNLEEPNMFFVYPLLNLMIVCKKQQQKTNNLFFTSQKNQVAPQPIYVRKKSLLKAHLKTLI
jgi:hypothetical protein